MRPFHILTASIRPIHLSDWCGFSPHGVCLPGFACRDHLHDRIRAVNISLRISTLTFSGSRDRPIDVSRSNTVVIIGPNNSGKSQALRDIENALRDTTTSGKVVSAVDTERMGTRSDFRDWLTQRTSPYSEHPGHPEHPNYRRLNAFVVDLETSSTNWETNQSLAEVMPSMVLHAGAEQRLHLAASTPSVDILDGHATEPLQRLLLDHSAERALSDAANKAFGVQLHVNRAGGSQLHLLLGSPSAEPRLDNPEYVRQLSSLERVEEQGDGVRSFVGLMLALKASEFPLVLIDEPEAFLHPPQARELGRQLSSGESQQRVVATHSSDVLLGLLDREQEITVIRLRRDGDRTVPAVLTPTQLSQLWSDPSLRYSRLLDGLFHRGVVVGEAESDARLYAATLDAARESSGQPSSDVLFTHCGGKHRLPTAINALRPMGVPVAAIADLDVLRDSGLLQRIIAALGGRWEDYSRNWSIVQAAVKDVPAQAPLVASVREQILKILEDADDVRLTEEQTRRVRDLTRSTDGWKHVRERGGLTALPHGDCHAAASSLIRDLATIGLFVVPTGALEGWAPSLGAHGPSFVQAALDANVHSTSPDLREFVLNVDRFLAGAPSGPADSTPNGSG